MKKLFFYFITLSILLTYSLVSCQKENTPSQMPGSNTANAGLHSSEPVELKSIKPTGQIDFEKLSLEEISTIHNEAMEYVVDYIAVEGKCPADTRDFRDLLSTSLEKFLTSRGLVAEIAINSIEGGTSFDKFSLCGNDLGLSDAAEILSCDIQTVFEKFQSNSIDDTEFSDFISKIIVSAENLSDPGEAKIVQIAAAICRSSAFFWKENLSTLASKLMSNCKTHLNTGNGGIPWKSVAYADVSGAVTGGRIGFIAAGGPAGAVAGGLTGSAGYSALRLLTFAIFKK
jgi:hypothetical protein